MKTMMKKLMTRFVSSGVLFAGLAACAASEAPTPAAEETSSTEAEVSTCCSAGAYLCPTGGEFDYAPPRCGELTKPQAKTACNNACGPACTDTGWQDTCAN
ncbi:MAG: hypothetical protein ACREBE_16495, partial [bacterium]